MSATTPDNGSRSGSLAASRLYNQATGDNGSFWAAGLHTLVNRDAWHLSGQVIRYGYDAKGPAGASNSVILMGGNGLTPAAERATSRSSATCWRTPAST